MADPKDALAYFVQAEILENQGRHEEAVINYDKGLQIDPRSWLAWNSRGIELAKLWKWDDAIVSFDRAIEIDPSRSEAWFNKGHSLVEGLTDYLAGIGCLEKAHSLGNTQAVEYIERIRQRMGDAHNLWKKALDLSRTGRLDEALPYLNQALDLNPRYAEAWLNKGAILAEQGNHKEALDCYTKAADINPSDSKAWFNKGISLLAGFEDYASAELCFVTAHNLGNPEGRRYAQHCRDNSVSSRKPTPNNDSDCRLGAELIALFLIPPAGWMHGE